MAQFGVTGVAHRFWTHRTFKAKLPLKIIFAICYASSGMVNYIFYFYINLFKFTDFSPKCQTLFTIKNFK